MIKNLAIVLALATMSTPITEAKPPRAKTEYYHQNRCGIVTEDMPPTTVARADINGDGVVDHFYARSGVIEKHKLVDGYSVDKKMIYESVAHQPYSCVDLRLKDLDDDGNLDLVYASTLEVVVFKNIKGKLEIEQEVEWYMEPTTRPRIRFERTNGRLSIVPYQELKTDK